MKSRLSTWKIRRGGRSAGGILWTCLAISAGSAAEPGPVDVEADRRATALLARRCGSCHGAEKQEAGLRFDSRDALTAAGDEGPAVVPGKSEAGRLLAAVRHADPDRRMPPKEPLSEREIALLRGWIDRGAPWPAAEASTAGPVGSAFEDRRNPVVQRFGGERLDLWSLKPPRRTDPPAVRKADWVRVPLDRYVLAALEAKGSAPSPEADRETLARRLHFDLLGLPPTFEEVREFVADERPDAYERLVDRLLASPHYGIHLAQLWLDVVRYADTNGCERDEFRPKMYLYRDYVVRSLNADKPYDRFLREQLAGDELPPTARPDEGELPASARPDEAETLDRLTATGYLRLGQYDSLAPMFQEEERARNELLVDLTNTTGSAFLGLTLSCCNCHDHKYDPLTQEDYFRLRAFFAAVAPQDETVVAAAAEVEAIERHNRELDEKIAPLEKELEGRKDRPGDERKALRKRIEELKRRRKSVPQALTMTDAGRDAPETHVLFQGDFRRPRQAVTAGVPSFFDPRPARVARPKHAPTTGRRTALAQWITAPENPFTTRVIVNRLWQRLFGTGIVATPNDFGYAGARPTHPELLDALAWEFVDGGWSLKRLQRQIVLSASYRQASAHDPARHALDPDNRLLWRQNPRRLTGEMLRDSLLFVSGTLLPDDSGPPRWPPLPEEFTLSQPSILEAKINPDANKRLQGWYSDPEEKTDVRSLFLIRKRCLPLPFLQAFDLPDALVSCGRRDTTIVAPQALNLLNDPFAVRMARALAERVAARSDEPAEQVREVFKAALARGPSEREAALGREFLARQAEFHRREQSEKPARNDEQRDEPARAALVDWCRTVLNTNEFQTAD